jgi:hypothetical protein
MPEPILAYIIPLSGGDGGLHPEHPIAPGGPPPWVSHPIPPTVWPNPPGEGSPPGGVAPPDPGTGGHWDWGWNLAQGWHPVYVPGDKPTPIPPPGGGTPPSGGGKPPDSNMPPHVQHPDEGIPHPTPQL